jgi:hypothetical protein
MSFVAIVVTKETSVNGVIRLMDVVVVIKYRRKSLIKMININIKKYYKKLTLNMLEYILSRAL